MGTHDLRSVYLAIIAAVGEGDDAALHRLIAADITDHNALPDQPPGRAGIIHWAAGMRNTFEGLHGTVHDTLVKGEVAARAGAAHRHPSRNPATRVEVDIRAFHILRFTDGLAAEWWGLPDLFGGLMQIGATITPPG